MDDTRLTPDAFELNPHPEGGWFRETWRTSETVRTSRGERSLATCITYLLQPGERSAWHRVTSAEMWLWQGGGPLRLGLGGHAGRPSHERDIVLSTGGQHLVEPDEWQCAEPAADLAVVVACVVSPGFDPADFTLA
jgi:predicted cupin superfamily sugar epimerase